ncbi:VWA domain-containing protein [bacterium]|nr:VWA domain-containing protein [bacterium]
MFARAPVLRRPEALLLLPLAVALAVVAARRSVVALAPVRARAAAVARFLLLASIVLALAETRAVLPRDELHVVFCADRSASIDPQFLRLELEWIEGAARSMTPKDRAALVVFGEDAQVERPLS